MCVRRVSLDLTICGIYGQSALDSLTPILTAWIGRPTEVCLQGWGEQSLAAWREAIDQLLDPTYKFPSKRKDLNNVL